MGKQDSARAVTPATPRPGDEHAGSANQVLAAAGSKVRHAHHTGGHDAVGSFEATPRLAQSPASPEDRIGQVLAGTYRIEELIAVGGMGAVYRASHARLSQPFAVKFLDPSLVRDAEAYGRFRQEAEIAAAVNHNNVLQVFDFSLDDFGSPYMVMELLQGRTLDIILKEQGALSSRELLAIFDPLCGAIDACHAAGVVHRDLKPSNIMVCSQADGSVTVKLLDFGISKIKHDGNDGMTRDNIVMGTPNYMSPEQASGQNSELDARADIFAIGAILYEALSGRRAFDADGLPQLLHKIVYKEPASLADEGVPPRVVEVVEACLAKKPEDRLGRAALIVGELKSAYEADTQLRKKSASKGLGAGSLLAVGLLTAVIGGGAGFFFGGGGKRAPAPVASVASAAKAKAKAKPAKASKKSKTPRAATSRAKGYPAQIIGTTSARLVSKDGRLYRGDRSSLSYWSDSGAEPVTRVLPTASVVTAMSLGVDGRSLAVAQGDGWLSVWDHELRQDPWKKRFGSSPMESVALGGGFVAFGQGEKVHLANVSSGRVVKKFPAPEGLRSIFFAPNLEGVVLAFGRSTVIMVDAQRRKALDELTLGGDIVRAYVSAETADRAPSVWVEFDQGEWLVRRSYRVVRPVRDGPVQLSLLDTQWIPRG